MCMRISIRIKKKKLEIILKVWKGRKEKESEDVGKIAKASDGMKKREKI